MSPTLLGLYELALESALLMTIPVIAAVAIVGVAVGLLQSLTGVSDQNLSFGPKLAVVALLALLAGPLGLAMVEELLRQAIRLLPIVSR